MPWLDFFYEPNPSCFRAHLVPLSFQGAQKHGQNKFIIVHEIYLRLALHVATDPFSPILTVSAIFTGKMILKTAPPEALLEAVIAPPCSSTILLETASPSPVPFPLVVKKG